MIRSSKNGSPRLVTCEKVAFEDARGAVLDHLLFLLEEADALEMTNTVVVLDILADIVDAEVERHPISTRSLMRILKLAENANFVIDRRCPPKFLSRRVEELTL